MGTEKVSKLLFRLSAPPSIIGMLVYAFYNVVDTIFIGRALGEESVSGIGGLVIAFPIHMLAMGIAIGLGGIGGSSIVSRALGSKELHKAEKALGTVFFLGIFLGFAYSFTGLFFLESLLKIFGATPGIMPYARAYLEIIMAGSAVFTLGIATEDLVRAEGNARYAMFGMIFGAGLNIILDPIFIFWLDMGVRGAAIATVLSQLAATVFLLRYFLSGKSSVVFKPELLVPDMTISKELAVIGIGPPFIIEASNSTMMIFVNNALATYGGGCLNCSLRDHPQASHAHISSSSRYLFWPPAIVGYNYGGAKQFSRVAESVKVALMVSTLFSLPGFLLMFFFPEPIIQIFSSDPELTAAGAGAMKIVVLILPFIGFQLVGTTVFQALGKPVPAFVLSLARQILFLLPPLVLILPRFYGLDGVWAAFPISDFLACGLAAGMMWREYRKYKNKEKQKN